MRLSKFPVLLFLLGLLTFAFAKPLAPETLMRIDVAGRGIIKIQLYTKEAPKTTAHIMEL
jgi:cyclophilin family peptidyl-prolyl cis-trans isomerase